MDNPLSRKKKFMFSMIMVFMVLTSMELIIRILVATRTGPGVLLYGTRFHSGSRPSRRDEIHLIPAKKALRTTIQHRNVAYDGNEKPQYSKYFPNEKKVDVDERGAAFEVVINSDGFRGKEIQKVKDPGSIRIVTLGASSTFGYHNRDHQSYPHQLEEILNRPAVDRRRFEVINLGIPHLKSREILALFMEEALPLDPDVVTFYEGYNDAGEAVKLAGLGLKKGGLQKVIRRLSDTFLTAKVLTEVVFSHRRIAIPAEKLDEVAMKATRNYLGNLSRIFKECRKRDIQFVIATQQSKSMFIAKEKLRGISYEEEEAILRKRAHNERRGKWEFNFLVHVAVNDGIRGWAQKNNVPLVDIIEHLDSRRDLLLSWVHPGPEANVMIAEALSETISQLLGQNKSANER